MKLALIGLANSGKTTLLNALAGLAVETHPYPTTEGEPHIAVVKVPDARVEAFAKIFAPKKVTYATVDYADFFGLVRGQAAHNRKVFDFLRDADALVHVIRAFESALVPHPLDSVDPLRDFTAVEEELILADLELVEKRLERIEEGRRKGRPPDEAERRLMARCREILEGGQPLRYTVFSAEERKAMAHLQFVSGKPLLGVVNLAEEDLQGARRAAWEKAFAGKLADCPDPTRPTVLFCSAKIEMEIAQLPPEEAAAFLEDLGIAEATRVRLIRASYDLLGLLSFLTVGEDEVRAWTIPGGSTALRAAGKIHSDIERGFIRAEVISTEEFLRIGGSMAVARQQGLARLEGKTYEVRDGDVINFKFNV